MTLIILLYVFLPVLQTAVFLAGQLSFGIGIPLAELMNYTASIFAVHWLMGNIILGTKIPWLQKLIPYDKRIQVHIWATAGAAAAVAYHGFYKLAAGYGIGTVPLLLAAVFSGLMLTSLIWIPLPGFRKFRRNLLKLIRGGREIKYDTSKQLHKLIIIGFAALITIHVADSGLLQQVKPYSVLLYIMLFAASVGLYIISITRKFRIGATVDSVCEHEGILTFSLRVDRNLAYKSGQFAFLEFGDRKMPGGQHPFSFLSSPMYPSGGKFPGEQGGDIIQFSARQVGPFSRALSKLSPGDTVYIRGPFGNFRPAGRKNICLIGSGIGIVPLMSIVKDLSASRTGKKTTVFLSVNKRTEVPELDEFLKITSRMDNLDLHLLVYQEDGILFGTDYFDRMIGQKSEYSYYLCSSPPVRRIVTESLKDLGIRKSAIHFEAFSFG